MKQKNKGPTPKQIQRIIKENNNLLGEWFNNTLLDSSTLVGVPLDVIIHVNHLGQVSLKEVKASNDYDATHYPAAPLQPKEKKKQTDYVG